MSCLLIDIQKVTFCSVKFCLPFSEVLLSVLMTYDCVWCLYILQIPVDVLEGITDRQARKMAENLEFKGPALDEVYQPNIYIYIIYLVE